MDTDDKAIAQALRQDPQRGFERLVAVYTQPLYWHIRRIVRVHDDAEDAAQETLIRIFRSLEQYNEACSLRAWIFRIATNEALRLVGKRSGREMLSLDEATPQELAVGGDGWFDDGDALAVRLQTAIQSLPPKQQMAFSLRYYDELSYAEIAEVISSTEASAKANYHVAKEKIIQYMNHND